MSGSGWKMQVQSSCLRDAYISPIPRSIDIRIIGHQQAFAQMFHGQGVPIILVDMEHLLVVKVAVIMFGW